MCLPKKPLCVMETWFPGSIYQLFSLPFSFLFSFTLDFLIQADYISIHSLCEARKISAVVSLSFYSFLSFIDLEHFLHAELC